MSRILNFLGIPGLVGLGVAIVLSTLLVIEKVNHADTRGDLDKAEKALVAEQNAHKQTQLNYRQAAEKARQQDALNKARAEAEQRATIERTKTDYEARIAAARSDYAQRLRDLAKAGSNPGGAGSAPVSGGPRPGAGTPQASPDSGLSLDERLVATEQAIQLDELINYVEGLLKVDLNGRQ
jgi:membrane protein involved in colicin uptake